MSLSVKIMDEMKNAMRTKDTIALEALRAIKSELLLAQTSSGSKEEIELGLPMNQIVQTAIIPSVTHIDTDVLSNMTSLGCFKDQEKLIECLLNEK